MTYNSRRKNKDVAIKLMTTLVLSLFFCGISSAQNQLDTLGAKRNMSAEEFRKLEQELLNYVETGMESKLISLKLRDSILQFIRETKIIIEGRFSRFAAVANTRGADTLPPNKVIILRDGIPILVDTTYREQKLTKKQLDLSFEKSPIESLDYATSKYRKNGVDENKLYSDKLPVPQQDVKNKNRYLYLSQEEIKRNIIQIDYFSKGMDGHYQKQIALGQTGQGWEETRAMRELVASIKASVFANVFPEGYMPEPAFLGEMASSRNSFVRFLGGMLGAFQNGARQQLGSGIRSSNPLAPIPMPARR